MVQAGRMTYRIIAHIADVVGVFDVAACHESPADSLLEVSDADSSTKLAAGKASRVEDRDTELAVSNSDFESPSAFLPLTPKPEGLLR
jgi:hypothetical protein